MTGKRFKIPKTGYLYIIQRQGSPVDKAKYEIQLENKTYDVVPSTKNQSISLISDIIVNLDNMCLDKATPGKELQIIETLEKQLGINLNELLLG